MRLIAEPNGMYQETYHGLSNAELKAILPAIRRELKRAEKMVEYYTGILECGEATERQTTALLKWENKVEVFSEIINYAKNVKL